MKRGSHVAGQKKVRQRHEISRSYSLHTGMYDDRPRGSCGICDPIKRRTKGAMQNNKVKLLLKIPFLLFSFDP